MVTNALIADRDDFVAAHPEQHISLRGRRWGVTDLDGPDETLVLLPGTLGRGDVFWRVMRALKGRIRIFACTYPATHDLAEWSDDLARLLDQRGVAQAHVLGSSLGGYFAQFFAGAHGDRCSSLIAANTLSSVDGIRTIRPYSLDLAKVPISELRAGFAAGLTGWAVAHPDQAELVDLLLGEANGRISARHLRARLLALKTAPAIPAIALPRERIAVIEAADDPLIAPPMRDTVRSKLDPSITFRFSSGGHFPYIARADSYEAVLESWLGLARPISNLTLEDVQIL